MKEKAKHKPLRVVDVKKKQSDVKAKPKERRGTREYTPTYDQTGSGSQKKGFQRDKP